MVVFSYVVDIDGLRGSYTEHLLPRQGIAQLHYNVPTSIALSWTSVCCETVPTQQQAIKDNGPSAHHHTINVLRGKDNDHREE